MVSDEWKRPPEEVMEMLESQKFRSTLSLIEDLKPDEEISDLYNVYISKNQSNTQTA